MLLRQRSDKQREASRVNGAKSRGPTGPRRPRTSAALAKLTRDTVTPKESDGFNALADSIFAELRPENSVERMLVTKLAAAHWRQMRVLAMHRDAIASHPSPSFEAYVDPAVVDLQMQAMRYDRQFARTLDQFLKLRANVPEKVASQPEKAMKANALSFLFEPGNTPQTPAENPAWPKIGPKVR